MFRRNLFINHEHFLKKGNQNIIIYIKNNHSMQKEITIFCIELLEIFGVTWKKNLKISKNNLISANKYQSKELSSIFKRISMIKNVK